MAHRKAKLDLDADSDDEGPKLKINKNYAEKYSTWRQKEELQKLKTKYGDEVVDSDESTSEEEDEDAEALTGQLEKDWLRTLAAVRSKDPRIYQKDVKFFHSDESEEESGSSSRESEEESTPKKKKKEKDEAMRLKDYERKFILEKGGVLSESEDDEDEEEDEQQHSPGYYEEQERLKKSFKEAVGDVDSDDDVGSLLKARQKTKAEKAKEEEEYLQWLKGEKEDLENDTEVGKELASLKDYWSKPDLDEREKFLRDFMLNKAYRSQDSDDEEYPSYEKLMAEIHEDEQTLEHQEEFERKYNFRFEEPNAHIIPRVSREIEDSVRRKDNKRALKRQEIKERKQREKEQKQEEIRQLKNLKKKEILEKLEQLKEVTGNPSVGFSEKDIEEDFDPDAHDKMMQKYFGDDFYQEEEHEKPEFTDDFDDGIDDEDWDAWEGPSSSGQNQQDGEYSGNHDEQEAYGDGGEGGGDESYADDPNFVMDADYDPTQATYTSGKKRKKSKFKQLIEAKKPTFEEVCQKYEGSDHPFGDYLDEYFKLDCEDIIGGDIKCRFRYRKTVPNDYGLTMDEILKCPDKELNAWASVKKLTQFRNKEDEEYEVRKYKKAKMMRKKYNVLQSLKESEQDADQPTPEKKKKKKDQSKDSQHSNRQQHETSHGQQKKRKRKAETEDSGTAETETQSGSPPSKKKHRMSDRVEGSAVQNTQNTAQKQGEQEHKKKKKKKKKAKQGGGGTDGQVVSEKKKKKAKKETVYDPKKDTLNERLKAFSVDPRKFKYTKHKKLNQTIG